MYEKKVLAIHTIRAPALNCQALPPPSKQKCLASLTPASAAQNTRVTVSNKYLWQSSLEDEFAKRNAY